MVELEAQVYRATVGVVAASWRSNFGALGVVSQLGRLRLSNPILGAGAVVASTLFPDTSNETLRFLKSCRAQDKIAFLFRHIIIIVTIMFIITRHVAQIAEVARSADEREHHNMHNQLAKEKLCKGTLPRDQPVCLVQGIDLHSVSNCFIIIIFFFFF